MLRSHYLLHKMRTKGDVPPIPRGPQVVRHEHPPPVPKSNSFMNVHHFKSLIDTRNMPVLTKNISKNDF